jgi:hypothetical protein
MKSNPLPILSLIAGVPLLVTSCKSDPPALVVTHPPAYLTPEQRSNVWLPDQVAPYSLGRYLDPRDPNVLHEAHIFYRREQTSRPNFTPPAALVLPPAGSASASNSTALLRDALTAELNEQSARSKVLVSQVQSVEQLLRDLSSRTQSLQEIVREAARVRAQLQAVSNRVETIEGRLLPETPPPSAIATAVSSNSPTHRP